MWKLELRLIRVVDGVETHHIASSAISTGKGSVHSKAIGGFLDAAVQAASDALRQFITKECER